MRRGSFFALLTVLVTAYCGQLWKPFLGSTSCNSDGVCFDLGLDQPAGDLPRGGPAPPDLAPSPWQTESSGVSGNLYGVWGANYTSSGMNGDGGTGPPDLAVSGQHTQVWAVGASGVVLTRSSTSSVWGRDNSIAANNNTLYAVTGRTISDVLVVGDNQFSGTWTGSDWIVGSSQPYPFQGVNPQETSSSYLAVGMNSGVSLINRQVRAVPSQGTIMPGLNFTCSTTIPSSGAGFIGSSNGSIYLYKDTGGSPTETPVSNFAIRSVWARAYKDAWLVGDNGLLMHYDGLTWKPPGTSLPALTVGLNAVTGSAAGQLWVVGAAGTIIYYDGKTWELATHVTAVDLHSVYYDAVSGGVWAVGDKGVILHDGPATK